MTDETFLHAAQIIGSAIERKDDAKALAMCTYMDKNFRKMKVGLISPQEYFENSKKAWDKAVQE